MTDTIKAEDIAFIWKKLHDSQRLLKQKDVYPALIAFREVLEKRMNTPMLHLDQKELDKEIDSYQQALFSSKIFRDVFGPVSFQDNENSTLLNFILQLIKVQDQDLLETVQDQISMDGNSQIEKDANTIMDLLNKGDLAAAKKILARSEKLRVFVANTYNLTGITNREKGEFDQSIDDYMKALVALPDDEGLYYNICRARLEKGDLEQAITAIKIAMKINPEFREGKKLLSYLMKFSAH